MHLYIKNKEGDEIELFPVVSTRDEMDEIIKLYDDENVYVVDDVYAKPSYDTSIGFSIVMFLLTLSITYNTIKIGLIAWSIPVFYFMAKIYFYFDKKAVEKFNKS